MQLPALEVPPRYKGLYVFDFGQWCAVGYTAEEIAMLLENEQYRDGKVYQIQNASPEGQVELRGVPRTRFELESGMFFYRDDLKLAHEDFSVLRAIADIEAPPCRATAQLADRGRQAQRGRYVTALVYPAEYESEMSRWLLAFDYAGGDTAEGGPSHVTNYREQTQRVIDKMQLWSEPAIPSRSADEVFGSVRQAVQR